MPSGIYESKLTDEDRIAFFTRPGASRPYVMPEPEMELSETNFFHDFPAKDQANKHALLSGNDETEAIRLNNRAGILLSDIRSWVQATQRNSAYSNGHNGSGANSENSEFAFGTGYGVERRHDDGPSALVLKEKYEAGSATKAKIGEPWIPGEPVVLRVRLNDSGQEEKYLHQVGQIMNLDFGQERDPSIKCGSRWKRYETVTSKLRGTNNNEPLSTAALIVPSTAMTDSVSDTNSTNRRAASNFDSLVVTVANENEREHAFAELEKLSERLTPKMYDALIAAAMGDTFDEIGRKFMPGLSATDRRPVVKGKTVVVDALEILILKEFRNAA